jgi:ATP-dependent Zn protease
MKPPMSELAKQGLLWVAVAVIVLLVYQSLSPRLAGSEQQMSYSEFVTQVKNDNVASITLSANLPTVVTGKLKDGSSCCRCWNPTASRRRRSRATTVSRCGACCWIGARS